MIKTRNLKIFEFFYNLIYDKIFMKIELNYVNLNTLANKISIIMIYICVSWGNMKEGLVESFVERVKLESNFHKFLKEDLIYQFIDCFRNDYIKKQYPKNIENSLEIALQFYKDYNNQYYYIILDTINKNKIIISDNVENPFVDPKSNKAFIKTFGNDSDLFIFVHEFAHFIDRNLNPMIIPNEYCFFCEVFSFYMEKQLELWLNDKEYNNLIETRRNNRLFFESRMLDAIEYELFCEKLYKKSGQIKLDDLNNTRIKSIMCYNYDLNFGLVNYLLQYPLANILSDYLINNQLVKNDNDICKICLDTNLYEALTEFKTSKKKNK